MNRLLALNQPQQGGKICPMRTRFILIDTSHAGNVGAAARAMKVMGFDDLVLVNGPAGPTMCWAMPVWSPIWTKRSMA
jgi:hypothetical protein